MSETDDDGQQETTGTAGAPGGGNVVRVDFAARRQKQQEQASAESARKAAQQRAADAARARPTPAELGPGRPEKLRVFARLVDRGMVMVTLDARREGVRVPPGLASELQLNLNFSLRFGIDDFAFDDDGVRASLSFRGTPVFCDVPWASVYMMTSAVDAERLMWPDSLPAELATLVPPQARPSRPARAPAVAVAPDVEDRSQAPPPAPKAASPSAATPSAAAPTTGPSTDGQPTDPDDGGPRPTPPRPTLRRVK